MITGQNFSLVRGDDAALLFVVAAAEGGSPDLAGAEIRWLCSRNGIAITKSLGSGISVAAGTAVAEVRVELTSVETGGLIAGVSYRHELEVTIAGKVTTVAQGQFDVVADIR